MGKKLGDAEDPLLVSVRSGAAVSMPGMMDTILNCGLHPGLAAEIGDAPRFWQLYAQFVRFFAKTVAGVELAVAAEGSRDGQAVLRCLEQYQIQTGRPFPRDPWQLLKECIDAVFRSWNSPRAIAYRQRNSGAGAVVCRGE